MIHYIKGDATYPIGTGKKLIVQINNTLGGWGAGFVLALSKRWSEPEAAYHSLRMDELKLGNVQYVQVEDDIFVANMIAQKGIGIDSKGRAPIRYDAVEKCLSHVNLFAIANQCTIHMPRIGCGLAGGVWSEIEPIIHAMVTVDVYVYDL